MKIYYTSGAFKVIRLLSGRSNVFLITDGNKNLIVDTGISLMWPVLARRLEKLNIKKVDYLVLTHTHSDHAANASRLKKKYGLKVILHRSEVSYLNKGENIIPAGTNNFTRLMTNLLGKLFVKTFRYEPCMHDFEFDDIMSLTIFGFDACIMHTPGHTQGSASIVVGNEIALVGDTMFGVFRDSAFPPFASDTEQMMTSWKKLLDTGCYIFIPSHGSPDSRQLVEKDFERRKNKLY
jgi:glyoxylase-like metal-dependent hydrolase (beta-lactamase superfamily II)